MAMHKSLFDLSPEQTASTAMPRTVVFSNGTGSGSMTICPLFLGAELYYNDMHLAFFEEATAPMRNVIEPEMRKQMEWYGVDLDVIRRYICTENRCCILRSEPTIAHIFSELYTAHSVPDTGYLRLKVLELLHILTRLKNREDVQQTEYFNQHQVECVKQAAALLTQELTVRRTIEQLAQEVGLSPTALKSCFKGIYGSSVYAYQKEYRLQLAQKLLLETDCTVAEIAHRVGYENPNKFSSAFREAAGMTPTEYRKMRPIG